MMAGEPAGETKKLEYPRFNLFASALVRAIPPQLLQMAMRLSDNMIWQD